jgi:hypothetical protein
MIHWFMNSSLGDRATLFLALLCYFWVMFSCFRSLTSSHHHVTWYRGLHATPIFQLLMWMAVLPLIIPALIAIVRRRKLLRSAPYIGNLRSRIFHQRECEYQRRMHSDFIRFPLASLEDGYKARFKACNWCISLDD